MNRWSPFFLLFLVSCIGAPGPSKVPVSTTVAPVSGSRIPDPTSSILANDLAAYKGPGDAPAVLAAVERRMKQDDTPLASLSRNDLVQYGGLQLVDHRLTAAQTTFSTLLARDDKDRQALYSLALIASARGKADESKAYIDRLLADFPKDWQALALKGQLALAENDKTAEASFQASLAVQENPDSLIGLAQIAGDDKRWDDAQNFLDRAVALDPNNDEAFAARSQIDQAKENWYSAETDITRAITLAPDDPWHYLDRARLYWQHLYKPTQALADTDAVLKADPQNFFGHLYRAQILDSKNRTSEAWAEYQWVLKAKPDYRYAYPPAAMLAFQYKNWTQAAFLALESAKDYPGEYAFPIIAALSYKFDGNPDNAVTILQNASRRYAPGTVENEIFRFLMNPIDDFALNDLLSKAKEKSTRVRLRFYQGCEYVFDKAKTSAKVAFQSVSEEHMIGIPEIRMAQDWLKDLGP